MNGWKVIAIIAIILLILETAFFWYVVSLGNQIFENEKECSVNICEDYDAFLYDEYESMCYCYENNEIKKEEYVKNA